ncbi:MAG: bifunctional oligoribonuclease/PAP phosphatase NrnA [Lachnospiraceae bacterium]|jgi:phosphoesterase RecJ-like protein|nr:bifunctional oligoribonuclease/PAP phosphatase NrnA [Lachnospiraceae bacterium]
MDIIKELANSKKIAISGHISPDGDSIGSCIAMTLYLRKRFPDKDIRLFLEEIPDCFKLIEGSEIIDSTFEGMEPDTYILIDTEPERMGPGEKLFKKADLKINIDHHLSNAAGRGDINYIDVNASSAAELVYRLIDVSYLDKTIATWIYLGIVHDTGVFKFPATSPETMRIAARLMEENINCQYLVDTTFYEKTYAQNLACARIVLNSKIYLGGKVIVGSISRKEMTEHNIVKNDFEGVINQLRITTGTEVAIFMYPMNDSTIKVSLRSKEKVDVSKICGLFGGGGHIRAAGFYYKGSEEEITNSLLDLLSMEDL